MIIVLGAPTLVESPDHVRAGGLSGDIATAIAAAGGSVQVAGKLGDDAVGDRVLLALAAAGVGHAAMLRDPALTTPVRSAPSVGTGADGGGGVWTAGSTAGEADEAIAIGLLVEGTGERNGSDGASATDAAIGPPGDASRRAEATILLEAADIELGLRYLVEFGVLIVATPLNEASAGVVAESAAFAGAQVIALDDGSGVPPGLGPATVLEVPSSDPDARFAELVAGFAIGLDRGVTAGEAFSDALGTDGWERIEP